MRRSDAVSVTCSRASPGPGRELRAVSHQAGGGEVRGHVLLNRLRESPGTFGAPGHGGGGGGVM